MFMVIISFPPIKDGKDAEFQQWFASSNQAFSGFEGFVSRKLLKPLEGGNYAAVVELESQAAFQAMHSRSIHDKAGEEVRPLFDGVGWGRPHNRLVRNIRTVSGFPRGPCGCSLYAVGERSLFHTLRNAPSVMGRAPARRKTKSPTMRSHSSLW